MDVYVSLQNGNLLNVHANEKLARQSWVWSYHACDGKMEFKQHGNMTDVIFKNYKVGEIHKRRVDLQVEHL